MTVLAEYQVTTDSIYVEAGSGVSELRLVTNLKGDTLYYKAGRTVTSTSNDGSLTAGTSATFSTGTSIVSATRTNVTVETVAPQTPAELDTSFVNAKDPAYAGGARGDNVADDTAAIQAAINSARHVYLPKGDYKITAPITVTTPGQRVEGAGMHLTRILPAFAANASAIVIGAPSSGYVHHAELSHMSIVGDSKVDYGVKLIEEAIQSDLHHLYVVGCTGTPGAAIGTDSAGATGGTHTFSNRIDRCFLGDTSVPNDYGVYLRDRHQWCVIRDCSIYNNNIWGIDAEGDSNSTAGGKVFVLGCDVESNGITAPDGGTSSYPSGNVRFAGITVAVFRDGYMECATGIGFLLDRDSWSGQNVQDEAVTIAGSYIVGHTTVPYAVVVRSARTVDISGNYIDSFTASDPIHYDQYSASSSPQRVRVRGNASYTATLGAQARAYKAVT